MLFENGFYSFNESYYTSPYSEIYELLKNELIVSPKYGRKILYQNLTDKILEATSPIQPEHKLYIVLLPHPSQLELREKIFNVLSKCPVIYIEGVGEGYDFKIGEVWTKGEYDSVKRKLNVVPLCSTRGRVTMLKLHHNPYTHYWGWVRTH